MATIPPAPDCEAYRKTPMAKYITKSIVSDLRQFMILPRTVADSKFVILAHLEANPYLKAASPEQVIKNLKDFAVTHYHSSRSHLDMRMDIPQGFSVISTDTSSVSSRLSRIERFGDEHPEEEQAPKDIFLSPEEMELEAVRKEVEELENRVRLRKELAQRKKKALEALKKEESSDEPDEEKKTAKPKLRCGAGTFVPGIHDVKTTKALKREESSDEPDAKEKKTAK
jgi:uncharacterized protein YlxP (DUF503 family)